MSRSLFLMIKTEKKNPARNKWICGRQETIKFIFIKNVKNKILVTMLNKRAKLYLEYRSEEISKSMKVKIANVRICTYFAYGFFFSSPFFVQRYITCFKYTHVPYGYVCFVYYMYMSACIHKCAEKCFNLHKSIDHKNNSHQMSELCGCCLGGPLSPMFPL